MFQKLMLKNLNINYEKLTVRLIATFFIIFIIRRNAYKFNGLNIVNHQIIDYIILCVSILMLIFSHYRKTNDLEFRHINYVYYIFVSSWMFFMFIANNRNGVLFIMFISLIMLFLSLISNIKKLTFYYCIVFIMILINISVYKLDFGIRFALLAYSLIIITLIYLARIQDINKSTNLNYNYDLVLDILNNSNQAYVTFDNEFKVLKENENSKKLLCEYYEYGNLELCISRLLNYDESYLINHINYLIDDSDEESIKINNIKICEKYINIVISRGKIIERHCYIMSILDNSEQFKDLETIEYLSNYDTLTYLPKREYLKPNLDKRILEAESDLKSAVLFIDLDRFKNINESYGYSVGDIVIRKFSERIKRVINERSHEFEDWILGHSSGDEFVLILYNYNEFANVISLIGDIMLAAKDPYLIYEIKAHISCSVGVAFYPENGSNSEELFKNASLALFNAKKLGGDIYQIYEKSIYNDDKGIHIMEEKIKEAMVSGEIETYYQPIIDLKNRSLSSAEALSRWTNSNGESVAPDAFIPVLERTGLIKSFDVYVTRNVIAFINQNLEKELPPISINISATTYSDLKIIQEIEEIIKENGACSKVRLEITETTAMSNVDYSKFVIDELSKSGIKMLLDDFGSGYSSLKYLRDFSFDIVKIDKELVSNVDVDNSVYSVLKACATMGEELGFEVLAEGVENESELASLEELGFRYIQGYFYSKALSSQEFIAYVNSFKSES